MEKRQYITPLTTHLIVESQALADTMSVVDEWADSDVGAGSKAAAFDESDESTPANSTNVWQNEW